MLIASLVVSCVFLVLVNGTAFRSGSILRALPWCALGLGGFFCMVLLPAFMLQAALTLVAGLACAWLAPRPRMFLAVTTGAFLVAYAVVGVPAWRQYDQLQTNLAPISVADRLSYEDRPLQLPDSPALGADVRLVSMPTSQPGFLENEWEGESRSKSRVVALRSLHDHQVSAFVNSPGFGISRGTGILKRAIVLPDEPPVPIEDSGSSIPPESAASMFEGGAVALAEATSPDLDSLHRAAVIDFVFPQGFGYVKHRDQVYGFPPASLLKDTVVREFLAFPEPGTR